MMHNVQLKTESKNSAQVSKALGVDNVRMEELSIETACSGGSIKTVISANSISTILSTVDDILRCQIDAESMIKDG
jgi:hypothetical protein